MIHWNSFIKLGKDKVKTIVDIIGLKTETKNFFKFCKLVRDRLHQLGFTSMVDVNVLLNTKIKTKGIVIGLRETNGFYQGYNKAA